jgi:predicted dehydrogenase
LYNEPILSENGKTRVAVVGAGSFGRNHARVYNEMQRAGEPVELAAIVDTNLPRAEAVISEFGLSARAVASVRELISAGGIDATSVAVPTVNHLEVARALMQAGIDVLIEKPLAPSLTEADELVAIATREKRIAMVGHLERFNPAIRATLPLITRPMFFEVHRLSVFTPRALDVDVVLDLMIHDLDIVLWLVRTPVRAVHAVGIPILSDKVDIANVRLEFDSGCVANFTASRVSTERVRKLRFFQPHQYVSVDYGRKDVFALTVQPAVESKSDRVAPAVPGFEISLPAGVQLIPSKPRVTSEEPLHAELVAFLESVRTRNAPPVPLTEARAALALALQILEKIAEHARRAKLDAAGVS